MLNKMALNQIIIFSIGITPSIQGCNVIIVPPSLSGQKSVSNNLSGVFNPVDAVADHLVLVSGNSQSGYPGAALSQSLRVQVQDQYSRPWAGGVALNFMRMLGIDSTSYSAAVTTDSNGYASFPVSLGYSPTAWQIVPNRITLPNTKGNSCGSGNQYGFSCGSNIGFTASPTSLGNGTFPSGVALQSSGSRPWGGAVADFNHDGKLDLITGIANALKVCLYMGNGNATFAAVNCIATPGGTRWIGVGDLDRDGNSDFVISDMNNGQLNVLLGNGDGTFKPIVNYPVGSSPQGVTVADVNGDGKLDLVVANTGGNSVSVLLGNGNGTFESHNAYPVGTNPYNLAVADFNGDGNLDIANTNSVSNNLTVILGNGNGTFQSAVSYAAGTYPQGLTAGDFNGDGILDLAVANGQGAVPSVGIFLGIGDGTFKSQLQNDSILSYPTSEFSGLVSSDFDHDGKLDLMVADIGRGMISVFLGNGDGTFQAQQDYSNAGGPRALLLGDFNGDRKIDVMSMGWSSSAPYLFIGN